LEFRIFSDFYSVSLDSIKGETESFIVNVYQQKETHKIKEKYKLKKENKKD